MTTRSYIFLLVLLPYLSGAVEPAYIISLEQAMRMAVEASPRVKEARLQADGYRSKKEAASSVFLPSMGSNTPQDDLESGKEDSLEQESRFEEKTGFRVEQPIFDHASITKYRSARHIQASLDAYLVATCIDVAHQAGTRYLTYVEAEQVAEITRARHAEAVRNTNYAKSRYLRGIDKEDEQHLWLEAAALLQDREDQQRQSLAAKRRKLEEVLFLPADSHWEIVQIDLAPGETGILNEHLAPVFASESSYVHFRSRSLAWAFQHAPQWQNSREKIEAERLEADPPWFLRMPTLSSYAAYNDSLSVSGYDSAADDIGSAMFDDANWTIGLMLSVAVGVDDKQEARTRARALEARHSARAKAHRAAVSKALDELWRTWQARTDTDTRLAMLDTTYFSRREQYLTEPDANAAGLIDLHKAYFDTITASTKRKIAYLQALIDYQHAIGWFTHLHTAEENAAFVKAVCGTN